MFLDPQRLPKPVFDKFFLHTERLVYPEVPKDGVLFKYPGHSNGPASGMKVLFLVHDTTACGHYRGKYPGMVLASQGAQVIVKIVVQDAPLKYTDVLDIEYIVLQRAVQCVAPKCFSMCQTLSKIFGTTIVYDLDDYLHGINQESPAYAVYNPNTNLGQESLLSVENYLSNVDGVIYSTRELQAAYKSKTKFSHVLTNGLDFSLGDRDWDLSAPKYSWREFADEQGVKYDNDTLLFGWSGSPTHKMDLSVLGSAVTRILELAPNTLFGMQTDPTLAARFCLEHKVPLDRVVYIPVIQFKDYPRTLSGYDVALCPLDSTRFNFCKSDLRILDHSYWGVPYVASKVANFWRFHLDSKGQGGYMAESQSDFIKYTVKLLTDEQDRKTKGNFIGNYIRENYDIRSTMGSYAYTLRAIKASRHGQLMLPSMTEVLDTLHKVPQMNKSVGKSDPCPCGSGYPYKKCKNSCYPAFGVSRQIRKT